MKNKQLDEIKRLNDRLMAAGSPPEKPSLGKHIRAAIVNGQMLRLRSAAEIIRVCRTKIAETDGYSRDLRLDMSEVFAGCREFDQALSFWKLRQHQALARQKKYRKLAQPIMDRALLDDEADAVEIAADLRAAAREAGMVSEE